MATDFFVDSFDPLHGSDRVLGTVPILGCTTTHSVNECLKLIFVSAHTRGQNPRGENNAKPPTLYTKVSRDDAP